jgi:hypothetical protein
MTALVPATRLPASSTSRSISWLAAGGCRPGQQVQVGAHRKQHDFREVDTVAISPVHAITYGRR